MTFPFWVPIYNYLRTASTKSRPLLLPIDRLIIRIFCEFEFASVLARSWQRVPVGVWRGTIAFDIGGSGGHTNIIPGLGGEGEAKVGVEE